MFGQVGEGENAQFGQVLADDEHMARNAKMPQSINSLAQIRTKIGDLIKEHPQVSPIAADILNLLEPAEQDLWKLYRPQNKRPGRSRSDFTVQGDRGGGVLTEGRPSGRSKPLRAPEDVFVAVVGMMARFEKPISFDDLLASTVHKLHRDVGGHQVRVVLRFLRSHGLVKKVRTRYGACDPTTIAAAAKRAWRLANAKDRS